jgi:hypothetical protein
VEGHQQLDEKGGELSIYQLLWAQNKDYAAA